ncbi:hypothetical protein TOPH_04391 [Tolypocladium ophioglossoides CBS 100239]|uniref:Uncharacterized protein n=1 Tax=Tolypocladium ophioglossoides (strain CBS 100239) TaxID=1163406 RepID=A0A0L0NAN4_TOLOC|nr:hypothetical protein TOPH_04391 [Tolypocladium ophioglossoides CBS 100239]
MAMNMTAIAVDRVAGPGSAPPGNLGRAGPSRRVEREWRVARACRTTEPLLEPASDEGRCRADHRPIARGDVDGMVVSRVSGSGGGSSRGPPDPRDTDFVLFEPEPPGWSQEAGFGSSSTILGGASLLYNGETQAGRRRRHRRRLHRQTTPISPLADRHSGVFHELGSWCDETPESHKTSPCEMSSDLERCLAPTAPPKAPSPPMLPVPELSPMATSFEFCLCCGDEGGRIGEAWHMTARAEGDAKLNWAKAYIEQMKAGGAPSNW